MNRLRLCGGIPSADVLRSFKGNHPFDSPARSGQAPTQRRHRVTEQIRNKRTSNWPTSGAILKKMRPFLAFAMLGTAACSFAQSPTLADLTTAARLGDLSKVRQITEELIQGPLADKPADLVTVANQIVTPNFPVDLTADPKLVEDARDAAQRAIQLDKSNAAAYEALARAQIFSGHFKDGIASMRMAIKLSPTPEYVRQRKETLRLLQRNGPRTRRQDDSLDNWTYPAGYRTTPEGTLGKVEIKGNKGPAIICVSLGYDAHIFDPIVSRLGHDATFYLITPAGMPPAPAPPMPPPGVSFGERTWGVNLENEILSFIKDRHLNDVTLLADDYASPQIMLHVAQRVPDVVSKLILINPLAPSMLPRDRVVAWVDGTLAPKWYKTVTKKTWAEGMAPPAVLCRDPKQAWKWFNKSLDVPVPVLSRYFSESLTDDVLGRADKLPQKMLVVLGKDDDLLATPLGAPTQRSTAYWTKLSQEPNSNVRLALIDKARGLISIDQPDQLAREISRFLGLNP